MSLSSLGFIALATILPQPMTLPLDARSPAAGQRLTYTGKLEASESETDDSSARSFHVQFLVAEATASGGYRILWILEEGTGNPRWMWPQRFGTIMLNKSLQPANDRELPAIQAERDGLSRAIALRLPFWPDFERLRADAKWEENQVRVEVIGQDDVAGRRSWRVGVASRTGHREIVWVHDEEPIVTRQRELVFLGQGVPHELSLELEKRDTVAADELARIIKSHATLTRLRGPLQEKLSELSESALAASPERLEQARSALSEIQKDLQSGAYVDLARESVRESQTAIDRQGSLEKFREKVIGKPVAPFTLQGTTGKSISLDDFKGKPVVLHFWDYRSEPKIAPYGETGYVDYLWRKREKEGIRVLGIAVDSRLREGATKTAARKDVRAFCEFMNLSYPVVFDDGSTKIIDQFGDPRSVGAKLPLYIVIAPDGTVAEYHAGLWSASADDGLKDLDQRLTKLSR